MCSCWQHAPYSSSSTRLPATKPPVESQACAAAAGVLAVHVEGINERVERMPGAPETVTAACMHACMHVRAGARPPGPRQTRVHAQATRTRAGCTTAVSTACMCAQGRGHWGLGEPVRGHRAHAGQQRRQQPLQQPLRRHLPGPLRPAGQGARTLYLRDRHTCCPAALLPAQILQLLPHVLDKPRVPRRQICALP